MQARAPFARDLLRRRPGHRHRFAALEPREPRFAFLESQLRVEDGIFVLTRERAVLLLADIELDQAKQVVERIRDDFRNRFPTAGDLPVSIRFHAVKTGGKQPTAKAILPKLFSTALHH